MLQDALSPGFDGEQGRDAAKVSGFEVLQPPRKRDYYHGRRWRKEGRGVPAPDGHREGSPAVAR